MQLYNTSCHLLTTNHTPSGAQHRYQYSYSYDESSLAAIDVAMSGSDEDVGAASKGHSGELGSEESGDEKLGLISKESGRERARKYGSKKFSSSVCCCCGNDKRSYICMLLGVITVLLLIVVLLVAVVVVLLVTDLKQGEVPTDGSNESVVAGMASDAEIGGEEVPWGSVHLQSSIVPETYDIDLTLNMDSSVVSGMVSIACSVLSRVDFIALHAVDMTISEHILQGGMGETVEHQVILYPENNFFIFDLANPIDPGPVVAVLHFNYTLRNDLAGFYRSSYKDASGNGQYLAVTQFEPTDARKAFPCFDEPSFKANFTISITHQTRYEAWSNMPAHSRIEQPDLGGGMVTTKFETSLKMSTYLVAFVVSDFECIRDTMTSISGKEVVVSMSDSMFREGGGWGREREGERGREGGGK